MGPARADDAALIGLLDRSLEVELRELARANPAAVLRDLPDVGWMIGAVTGSAVHRTSLASADAPARIAELSDALDVFGPVTWWAAPTSTPSDLRTLLTDAGYRLEDDEAGMAVHLDELIEDLPRPAGLRLDAVERQDGTLDLDLLDGWLEANRRTLDWPADKVARRRALYRDDERRPRPWRHVVARLGDEAVAAARVLVDDRVAMVHGVVTIPAARRQGIGSAVTVEVLRAARDAGCQVGVLQASSMGQGPYRRIGFRTVAAYGRYVREPAGFPAVGADVAGNAAADADDADDADDGDDVGERVA